MESVREYRIITNNPLVKACFPPEYRLDFFPEESYRDILVRVRDLVYAGHRMYTHPLAGSGKPNETPYKSVVVSCEAKKMEMAEAVLIASAIETFDKFTPRNRELTQRILNDFQLIDYTLLCGALNVDAVSGLSRRKGN